MSALYTHSFTFNTDANGGEVLILRSVFYDEGEGKVRLNQELTLQSYGNSAKLTLVGAAMTPEKLRQLADELFVAQAIAKQDALDYIKT